MVCCYIVMGSLFTEIKLEEIMSLDVVCDLTLMTLCHILNVQTNESIFLSSNKKHSAQSKNGETVITDKCYCFYSLPVFYFSCKEFQSVWFPSHIILQCIFITSIGLFLL
jgi:hypothetical protein